MRAGAFEERPRVPDNSDIWNIDIRAPTILMESTAEFTHSCKPFGKPREAESLPMNLIDTYRGLCILRAFR